METMGVTQKKKLPTQPVLFTVVQHWRDLRKFRKTFGKGEGGLGAVSTGNTLVSLNHTISPTLHIRKKGRNTFLSWIGVPLCYRKWCSYLFLFLGFVLFCFCLLVFLNGLVLLCCVEFYCIFFFMARNTLQLDADFTWDNFEPTRLQPSHIYNSQSTTDTEKAINRVVK